MTPTGSRTTPALLPVAALIAVTASWGSTFFMLKDLLERMPVADLLALRFTVAAAALWLLRPGAVAGLGPRARRQGLLLGAIYGGGQLLQTTGLQHTSASVSGFITGMYVVLTPVLGAVLLRARVGRTVWTAVAPATAGLAVLSLHGFALGFGELLTLLSAALYALHIVGLGAWSTGREAYGLAVVQMATIAAVCCLAALPGGLTLPGRAADWAVLLYLALVAGAAALVLQTWAQAHLAATRAAIVMTTEPVWAGAFAVAFGGERLGARVVVGGALVLAAMVLAERPSASWDRAGRSPPVD